MTRAKPSKPSASGAKCPKTMQVRLSPKAAEIVRRSSAKEKRTHPKQASYIIEKSESK